MVPRVQPIIENEPRMAPNWKRNEMKNEDKIVGKYLTATGKNGITVTRHTFRNGFSFSYTGKWGTGSTTNLDDLKSTVSLMLRVHPRNSIEINFFYEIAK